MTKTWRQPPTPKPPTREVRLKHPLPPGVGPFDHDVDPKDSESLRRLRELIDSELGWATPEDEEAGDYEARLRQVAEELREHRRRDGLMRRQLTAEQAARRRANRRGGR